ncbi:MAG: hypothetical protein WCL54_06810 [Clostridia bacterium]
MKMNGMKVLIFVLMLLAVLFSVSCQQKPEEKKEPQPKTVNTYQVSYPYWEQYAVFDVWITDTQKNLYSISDLPNKQPVFLKDHVKSMNGALILQENGTLWKRIQDNKLKKLYDNVQRVENVWSSPVVLKKDQTLWNVFNSELIDNVSQYQQDYALKTDGSLWTSIGNKNLKILDGVKSYAADISSLGGSSVVCAILNDDSLWMYGSNQYGSLGNGSSDHTTVAVKVMADILSAFPFFNTVYAIKKDQSLWSWGYNNSGQVGNGASRNVVTPIKILDNVKYVGAIEGTAYAILNDNTFWIWGAYAFGKPNEKPKLVSTDVNEIITNVLFSPYVKNGIFFMKNDHSLWQVLEVGPQKLLDNVKSFYTSLSNNCAVLEDGSLMIWKNAKSFVTNRETPFRIDQNVSSIVDNLFVIFYTKDDGSLWQIGKLNEITKSKGPYYTVPTEVKLPAK